jgi:hypothetical protein
MERSEFQSLWTRLRSGDTSREFLLSANAGVMLSALGVNLLVLPELAQ